MWFRNELSSLAEVSLYETFQNEEFAGMGKEISDKVNVALLSARPIWGSAYSIKLQAISDSLTGLLVRIYTRYTRDRKWSTNQYTSALLCVYTEGLHIDMSGVLSEGNPRLIRRERDMLSQSRYFGIPLPAIIQLILHFLALRLKWSTPQTSLTHKISEARAARVSLCPHLVTDLKIQHVV